VDKADKARRIEEQLETLYANPPIPLKHSDAYTLLIAVLLSAQCTDVRVNEVTPQLFGEAPNPKAMVALGQDQILPLIRSCGLGPTKAKNIFLLSQALLDKHGGQVPSTFKELEALPGVGHKTASVVMSQAFGKSAFPVDTHIFRLARRWGLSEGKTVNRVEVDLKKAFPEESWNKLHLQIIYFGREYCPARGHNETTCPICSWAAG
jgi:endonuclease III